MTETPELPLAEAVGEAAVLRVYQQVFAVLAREAGAMIADPALVDVDEAILGAFADAGTEGLAIEQAVLACRQFRPGLVQRRFEVLREYGAISRLVDRPSERFHRAAFAPYVMLLFLRRMAAQGGQSELHQLLAMEHLSVKAENATAADGVASAHRLTKVFRLLANELGILVAGSPVETLRDNAQLLWGNRELISQTEEVHATVLKKWPELGRDCAALRIALAAYGDAVESAASRLLEQVGATRALGLLPPEAWLSFARSADEEKLAAVLDQFVFDAPAPWFSPQALMEAVESGRPVGPPRMAPPRTDVTDTGPETGGEMVDDAEDLRALAELILGERNEVRIPEILNEAGDWLAGRRVLATVTSIHQHPALGYELIWEDGLRIEPGASPSWVSDGIFRRLGISRDDDHSGAG